VAIPKIRKGYVKPMKMHTKMCEFPFQQKAQKLLQQAIGSKIVHFFCNQPNFMFCSLLMWGLQLTPH
jgi:hypothetical protein